jgi:hypothetical protein
MRSMPKYCCEIFIFIFEGGILLRLLPFRVPPIVTVFFPKVFFYFIKKLPPYQALEAYRDARC